MPRNSYKTEVLVLQPTPFCNLDCTYCYLPGRDQRSRMDLWIPVVALERLDDAGCLGNELDIHWHAGEPLVLPVEYYAEAIDKIESAAPPGLAIAHHFQTNATLISDEFCRFAKDRRITVGVSLDGPEDMHDRNRSTRGGGGTHKLAMQGIRKLEAHRIPFSVIAVLTQPALSQPDLLFRFFSSNGFGTVCFNLEEILGIHKKSSLNSSDMTIAVKRFFIQYTELLRTIRPKQWVREIDGRLERLFSGVGCREKQNQPLAIVSVNWKGDLSTFCPELVDLEHPRFGNFMFGNVLRDRIQDILMSEKFRLVNHEIQEGVAACKEKCNYFAVCGGGTPAAKLAETGTFATTETVSCRLAVQSITDVLLDYVESAASK